MVHERYRRQTDGGRWHIANMNLSSRSLKIAYRYNVRWIPFVPYVVNTNSARQVALTESKSHRRRKNAAAVQSAKGVLSRLPKCRCLVLKHWLLRVLCNENGLFPSCRSWSAVSRPPRFFSDGAWCVGASFIQTLTGGELELGIRLEVFAFKL